MIPTSLILTIHHSSSYIDNFAPNYNFPFPNSHSATYLLNHVNFFRRLFSTSRPTILLSSPNYTVLYSQLINQTLKFNYGFSFIDFTFKMGTLSLDFFLFIILFFRKQYIDLFILYFTLKYLFSQLDNVMTKERVCIFGSIGWLSLK